MKTHGGFSSLINVKGDIKVFFDTLPRPAKTVCTAFGEITATNVVVGLNSKALMPCPSISPKQFWSVQNGFGLTKLIWT